MDDLTELWPDPDRRDVALLRALEDVYRADEERTHLAPSERRALQAAAAGLDAEAAGRVLGVAAATVRVQLKMARRALRAKNTTHACCEALRRGLIS